MSFLLLSRARLYHICHLREYSLIIISLFPSHIKHRRETKRRLFVSTPNFPGHKHPVSCFQGSIRLYLVGTQLGVTSISFLLSFYLSSWFSDKPTICMQALFLCYTEVFVFLVLSYWGLAKGQLFERERRGKKREFFCRERERERIQDLINGWIWREMEGFKIGVNGLAQLFVSFCVRFSWEGLETWSNIY